MTQLTANEINLNPEEYATAVALRKDVLSLGEAAMKAFSRCDDVVKGRTNVQNLLTEAELKEVHRIRDLKLKIETEDAEGSTARAALAELLIIDRYFNAFAKHLPVETLKNGMQAIGTNPAAQEFLKKHNFKILPKLAA